ncbi:MAG: adenylate/guanylate cyclase domain-containing protein [Spirochaetaceae bacterium]|nr:adenylate/guanylate cyclase domain-containing protein [Spirochaetaceae bacterium]
MDIVQSIFGLISYLVAAAVSAFISSMHYSLKNTKKDLEEEHKKAQLLLSNIFPDSIAERLKNGESLIADRYIESTILFCDLVGFTHFSRHHSPEEMVSVLDELISSFDILSESYGLEKIKTIGDAYLVVCGLPEKREDHAVAIATMALAMIRVVEEFNSRMELDLKVRIGIHSGPVIGGVIGKKKFTFDIWGDTVNIASRLESHGIPGEIQVSRETYMLLKDIFDFEKRGTIEIKNVGEVKTWLLKGEIGK